MRSLLRQYKKYAVFSFLFALCIFYFVLLAGRTSLLPCGYINFNDSSQFCAKVCSIILASNVVGCKTTALEGGIQNCAQKQYTECECPIAYLICRLRSIQQEKIGDLMNYIRISIILFYQHNFASYNNQDSSITSRH